MVVVIKVGWFQRIEACHTMDVCQWVYFLELLEPLYNGYCVMANVSQGSLEMLQVPKDCVLHLMCVVES